ncbi:MULTISPECIES: hypothetical protein [Pseudomonas]|uniref:hypothetical protein n=1 Tax=Pseudomonas TaxID=286 RepID=UPI00289C6399|nr:MULTISPECIES: hypothetical protein [Pseudomonas]
MAIGPRLAQGQTSFGSRLVVPSLRVSSPWASGVVTHSLRRVAGVVGSRSSYAALRPVLAFTPYLADDEQLKRTP